MLEYITTMLSKLDKEKLNEVYEYILSLIYNDSDLYLTTDQLAQRFGLSHATVELVVKENNLKDKDGKYSLSEFRRALSM